MKVSGDGNFKEQVDHYRRIELFNTACSDVALAITPQEQARLLEELPDARVEVLPNIHDPQPLDTPFEHRKGLLFIGGFWHRPNGDAVRYFVDQILSLVVDAIPDIVFYIVGSNMPPFIRAMRSDHIEPLGYITDVQPYFSSCRVFVAPLRYGAGMKGKIGQSIAYGLPVVTTTIGAEGMGLVDGKHMLLADTPGAFADAVIRLYFDSDFWYRLSANALAHLQENYSLAATRQRLAAMFPLPERESGSRLLHQG
jgi:glycosyltransferase involved in cell wall biosynthesis